MHGEQVLPGEPHPSFTSFVSFSVHCSIRSFKSLHLCILYVCMHAHIWPDVRVEVRGQLGGRLSSAMWVCVIKLRTSGLVTSVFTCWVISRAPGCFRDFLWVCSLKIKFSISSFFPPALLGTPVTRVSDCAIAHVLFSILIHFPFFHSGWLSPLCLQMLEGSAHPVTPSLMSFYVTQVPS